MMPTELLLRFAGPDDLSLVFSSWLKCHRDIFFEDKEGELESELTYRKTKFINHDSTKFMSRERYFSSFKLHINRLVERSKVLLICNPETPKMIYAYIVYQDLGGVPVVHYAYTKQIYRKLGFMRRLVSEVCSKPKEDPILVTFHSAMVRTLKDKYKLVFDPYLGVL